MLRRKKKPMPDKEHVCPRRIEDGADGPHSAYPGPDTWFTGRGFAGSDPDWRHCSYCGSLHPDTFMELLAQGFGVGPTDKSYKVYLTRPVDDAARANHAEMVVLLPRLADQPVEGSQCDKFYFQHLSVDQQHAFIDMINAKTLHIGYPGHFYRLPFFMKRGE